MSDQHSCPHNSQRDSLPDIPAEKRTPQMRRAITFVAITLLLFLSFIPTLPTAHAQPQIGPLDISGEIHGAPYRIMVPANWNGTLLVFAHGYRDKADHPGEIDNRNVD